MKGQVKRICLIPLLLIWLNYNTLFWGIQESTVAYDEERVRTVTVHFVPVTGQNPS